MQFTTWISHTAWWTPLLCLLYVASADAKPDQRPTKPEMLSAWQRKQEIAIQEAVFRRMVVFAEERYRGDKTVDPRWRYYFLRVEVNGKEVNPDLALLKRLWRRGLPVRNASESVRRWEPGFPDGYLEKATGAHGFLLSMGSITWKGRREAVVGVVYASAWAHEGVSRYRLKYQRGRWCLSVDYEGLVMDHE